MRIAIPAGRNRLHKRGIYRCAICSLSLLCWPRFRSRRRQRTRIFSACLVLIAAAATTAAVETITAAATVVGVDAAANRVVAATKAAAVKSVAVANHAVAAAPAATPPDGNMRGRLSAAGAKATCRSAHAPDPATVVAAIAANRPAVANAAIA